MKLTLKEEEKLLLIEWPVFVRDMEALVSPLSPSWFSWSDEECPLAGSSELGLLVVPSITNISDNLESLQAGSLGLMRSAL